MAFSFQVQHRGGMQATCTYVLSRISPDLLWGYAFAPYDWILCRNTHSSFQSSSSCHKLSEEVNGSIANCCVNVYHGVEYLEFDTCEDWFIQ